VLLMIGCALAAEPAGADGLGPVDARIAAAARGDRAAAAEVLTAILPRARNLIRYLVRGDAEVDDMAQEALIAVLRGLPSYRGDGTFRSWSDRVVVRSTFAALRKRRTEDARHAAAAPELLPVDDRPAVAEYLSRRDLARVLDELPAEQRHALVLHHAVGMSVPEIAAEVGVPQETVRSRLRLGMASLRSTLEIFRSGERP
jgi:RNA polymerase sigma-70 factor (ECF subfamily)